MASDTSLHFQGREWRLVPFRRPGGRAAGKFTGGSLLAGVEPSAIGMDGASGMPYAFVAKLISPHSPREVRIHDHLSRHVATRVIVPRFLGVDDGGRYLLLEAMQGRHPDELVDLQAGVWSPEARLALGRSIARAYRSIHSAGVLHRDVHSRNILVPDASLSAGAAFLTGGAEGLVRILDFGLSVEGEPGFGGGIGRFPNPDGWAQERTAPPEAHQAGGTLTVAAETYAVIAMIWRLFDSDYPFGRFDRRRPLALQRTRRRTLPVAARELGLDSFFTKGLASDPSDRYRSMDELILALDAPEPEAKARRTSTPPAKRDLGTS